jgi:predicted alpha/beta-hydrolase family hydrolase
VSRPGALLLAPGAGSDSSHPALRAVEAAVAPLPVTRMDFPYRLAGRKAPDREPVLLAAVREQAAATCTAAHIRPDRLVLGGRSMGGRMCSIAVAQGLAAAGLVLIAYPLHPPGRPEKLRTAHLGDLHVPCLFISGTRDPFGTPEELEVATATISAPVTHVWVEGGRHELKGAEDLLASTVAGWIRGLGTR